MGKTLRIVTHKLNSRTVGQIVEMTALDGAKRDGGQSETFRKSDSAMPISANEPGLEDQGEPGLRSAGRGHGGNARNPDRIRRGGLRATTLNGRDARSPGRAIIGGTGILPVLSSYAERAGRPFP